MEHKFIAAWMAARAEAAKLGVRLRPLSEADALATAHRWLSGHRVSDGFDALAGIHRLELSLEALAVRQSFGGLFSDQEANTALSRLLEAGYRF